MNIDELLRLTVERGASDLHLKVANVPFLRVDGDLQPTTFPVLTAADTEAFARAVMSDRKRTEFEVTSEADIGYTLAGVGRFRINVFRQRTLVGLAVRRVRSEIPTFEELRLPAVMRTLSESPRGLVLVTGPTGTGKTTTIAAMIGFINRSRRAHIVTIEDPIEVVHDDELSIIQQREVGVDTDSYAGGAEVRRPAGPGRDLRRRDPRRGVGALGDPGCRDRAPRHLDAAHDRLHGDDQPRARPVPAAAGEGGADVVRRRAARHRVAATRAEGRRQGPRAASSRSSSTPAASSTGSWMPDQTDSIVDVIAEGGYYGMQTFDQALVQLVKEGFVTVEDARRTATSPHDFDLQLAGVMDRRTAFSDEQATSRPF